MQNQPVTQVLPQLTPSQIQANIDNMHWQEKQQEIAGAWQRQNSTVQQHIAHTEYMVDHIATPLMFAVIAFIVAAAICICTRIVQREQTVRNQDDNSSSVLEAQKIFEARQADGQ